MYSEWKKCTTVEKMPREDIGVLELPFDVVAKCNGFSFDMGGSVMKLAYNDKADWEEAVKNKADKTKVRMVSFPSNKIKEAIEYLKERCHINRSEATTPIIYGTGIGGYQFAPIMNKELNISTEILMETDCFVKAHTYLCKELPFSAVCHERNKKVLDALHEYATTSQKQLDEYAEQPTDDNIDHEISDQWTNPSSLAGIIKYIEDMQIATPDSKPLAESENIYPCLMGMFGSGLGYMKIGEDGKYALTDVSNRGGRTFLGLGCMLTGAKTFDELISLARAGNNKNVDVYTSFMAQEAEQNKPDDDDTEQKKNMYSESLEMNDEIAYCFGRGVRKTMGDFKKEDMALALLNMMCMDISETVVASSSAQNVKRVFFSGSFVNSDLVREMLSDHLLRRQVMLKMFQQEVPLVTFDFIKGGSHLGALGAFIFGEVPKSS